MSETKMNLDETREEVMKCKRCSLHETKIQYVFGSGSPNAKIMFIGEAPGANEDKTGVPFVGRAGQVFDEILQSLNINRGEVFIANILKCRPPENRQPQPIEIERCVPFLDSQIENIKPKVICPMGNFATSYILRKYGLGSKVEGISKLHGKIINVNNLFANIIVLPLYHPAVATYNPYMKDVLIKDAKCLEQYK